MPSLGTLGLLAPFGEESRKVPPANVLRQRAGLDTFVLDVNVEGTLSGIVTIAAVATARVRVGLYYRSNLQLIETALTDSAGAYSFSGLDITDLKSYLVIVLDPNADSPYNFTLARDHLTAA